jgi:hypothetical protein
LDAPVVTTREMSKIEAVAVRSRATAPTPRLTNAANIPLCSPFYN